MSSPTPSGSGAGKMNLVSKELELSDPNPDIFALFVYFNDVFFQGQLGGVTVQWSPRMTLCAGLCRFKGPIGGCSIHLSKPLLTLRPRKDLIETLLHEMIHAFLFVTDKNREREDHGPKFTSHMNRINERAGTNISVYHSFHDEVEHYKTHWWKCNGPCQHRSPYFGIVKRSMNRAPGKNDFWYADHQRTCGGSYTKIKEPSPKKKVMNKRKNEELETGAVGSKKITQFFPKDENPTQSKPPNFTPTPTTSTFVFTGTGQKLGSGGGNRDNKTQGSYPPVKKIRTDGRPPEHPLLALWNSRKNIENRKPLLSEFEQKVTVETAKTSSSSSVIPETKKPKKSYDTDLVEVIVLDSD